MTTDRIDAFSMQSAMPQYGKAQYLLQNKDDTTQNGTGSIIDGLSQTAQGYVACMIEAATADDYDIGGYEEIFQDGLFTENISAYEQYLTVNAGQTAVTNDGRLSIRSETDENGKEISRTVYYDCDGDGKYDRTATYKPQEYTAVIQEDADGNGTIDNTLPEQTYYGSMTKVEETFNLLHSNNPENETDELVLARDITQAATIFTSSTLPNGSLYTTSSSTNYAIEVNIDDKGGAEGWEYSESDLYEGSNITTTITNQHLSTTTNSYKQNEVVFINGIEQ